MSKGRRVSVELDPVSLKKEMGNNFTWLTHLDIVCQSPRYDVFHRATIVRACACILNFIWQDVLEEKKKIHKIEGLYSLALAREESFKTILDYLGLVNQK